MSKMNVLVVEPGKKPYTKEIKSGLDSLQKEVGGYIEALYPFEDPVALVCNEEGKMNGLPLNRALYSENVGMYEAIAGTFLVVGLGSEDFISLGDEFEEKYKRLFEQPQTFVVMEDRVVAVPDTESQFKEILGNY